MNERANGRQRRQQRVRRRAGRWEAELAAARTRADRLTVAYRWCLAEMRRDTRARIGAWWNGEERFDPAIEALIRAARGGDQT
jgi:hypothetical protein